MEIGKYELLKKIAVGGMAEVFLARTVGPKGFQKILVLKRILPHLADDPAFVDMFLSEAKLAAQFSHPNIVQIFDFGEVDGISYIAMEFVDGPNLRTLQGRALDFGEPLPLGHCAKIISLACEGLAYAHEFVDPSTGEALGVVHRDISPDNLLVARNGYVKVVDFGIAKASSQSHKTKTGTIKGKFAYMPPEQLQNQPLDRRADVFALGMVLYELVTGTKPFDGSSEASILKGILFEPFIPAASRRADIPRELSAVIDRALAKERDQRYPSCREMQADLERYIMSTGQPVSTLQIAELVGSLAIPNVAGELQGTPAPRSLATPAPAAAPPRTGWGMEPTAAKASPSAQPLEGEDDGYGATRAKASPITGANPIASADPEAFAPTTAKQSPVTGSRQAPVARPPEDEIEPTLARRPVTQAKAAPVAEAPQARAAAPQPAPPVPGLRQPAATPRSGNKSFTGLVVGVLGVAAVGVMATSYVVAQGKKQATREVVEQLRTNRGDVEDAVEHAERIAEESIRRAEANEDRVREVVHREDSDDPVGEKLAELSSATDPTPAEPAAKDERVAARDERDPKEGHKPKGKEPRVKNEVTVASAQAPAPSEPANKQQPAAGGGDYDTLVATGTRLMKDGKVEQALQNFKEAQALDATRPEALTGEGWALINLKRPDAAEKAFRRALKAEPGRPTAMVGLGKAYADQKQEDKAVDVLERFLKKHPEGPMSGMAQQILDSL